MNNQIDETNDFAIQILYSPLFKLSPTSNQKVFRWLKRSGSPERRFSCLVEGGARDLAADCNVNLLKHSGTTCRIHFLNLKFVSRQKNK